MRCPSCDHDNRAGRKFCVECGATLALACAACSAPYEAGEKFCGECGAPLGAAAPRPGDKDAFSGGTPVGRDAAGAGARKVVTIIFADLVGSTALHERLDAESARRVMERYYAALRAAVATHGGTVVKLLGDGVMAAFGLQQVAEDDALRAVRAGVAMQEAFRALVRDEATALGEVGLRVAVNTGEVVVTGAHDDVVGDPVNVAARLQEQARDGDVVLGESTRRLVATRVTLTPLGSVTLKGRAEAVAAYRLVSLDAPAGATTTAFVGRETELARLEAVYDAAVATPATRLVVLLGSPGLGKSRLIEEIGRRHAEAATILVAHCDAAGGATFAPLAQAVRGLLGLDDSAVGEPVRAAVAAALDSGGDESERTRIAAGIDGLLTGAPTSPEETFFVIRRFLAGLAVAKPAVLVIDDLHWAEPLLLDLVEHLVQWGSGVPLLVLIGARPELRELRSSLVTPGGLVADVVTLGGLDAGAATRLAANVIGAADLPAAVAAKVLATSEGNPLFVGELVRMLVQEGALTKEGERWTAGAGLAALEMPPTIHALLAARIERLRPEECTVLERAAVVGRHFSRSAVAALLGRNGSELDARLESLRRSELIERDTGWLLGEPILRFHHVLIRDAAYRRLLKGTRAELHGRLADWIEARVGDAPEHDEMIGWHLEQAHQHLRELGPVDAAGVLLGERAARRLAAAGRRALARDDVSLASSLLGRALDRLAPDVPERADLVLDWCEALLSAGDVGPAAAAIAELERVAKGSDRLRAWHTCFAGQLTVLTAPEALHATADRVGAAARDLAALGDAAGEAKAHFVHAQALARLGKVGACEAALDQALAAARRAGDRRRANAVLAGAPLAALWGPSPVTRASGRCLDVVRVLRITQGAPAVEAVALSCQGVLEALRGRTEAARRMLASSRTMVEELGITHRLFETDVFAGRIDLLEGNAPAAERALRTGYEGLRDLGLGIDAARAAALLGRALLAQDRAAEAETLSHESELLAGDDLQATIAWRGVRAEALARRGDHAAAITFAEAAVAIAAATDALLDHADARLALAAALRAAGRRAEADAEECRAFELWEAKGATLLAERARRDAAGGVAAAQAPDARSEAMPRLERRVRPNAASAMIAAVDAAFARRDIDALGALLSPTHVEVDHRTRATRDGEGTLDSLRRFMRSRDPEFRNPPLATLGDALVLCRRWVSATGSLGPRFDVGPYENEAVVIFETDEHGLAWRTETFACDRLGDAIVRLYERYAELQPDGPERERATVATRAVAFMLTPGDAPDLMQLYTPTYEDIDHRTVGYGALSYDEAKTKLRESFRELVDGLRYRVDDVLALDPNGFVRKTTASGVWRQGGGSFERTVCTLSIFGPDGRVTRHETFDADREAEALARFDALTAAPVLRVPGAAPRARARVRPNAITRVSAEFEGIVAARDFAALATFFAEDVECIDHPTGATYDGEGMCAGIRRLMQSPDARLRFIPLATLGASWGLVRREMSASGAVGGHFDVGAYEIVDVAVYGTDERGRLRHCEIFAAERLRAALVCLYERYAESLPEGAARTRASGIARSSSTYDGPIDADRIATGLAQTFVCVDHRILGTWSAQSREEWLTHWRAQAELTAGFTCRDDDILALAPTALLVRETFFGTNRIEGGLFENVILALIVFGADGLYGLAEIFEPDREAEALTRFDALTADAAPKQPIRRRVRPNAATRTFAAIEAAFTRRDLDAIDALLGDPLVTIEHPTGTTYGRDGQLESSRRMMRMPDLDVRIEPLATLGDSLCLARRVVNASGTAGGRFDVGEYEIESIVVNEVDEAGRLTSLAEVFARDHLCQAIVRLYARYAESLPDGPERTRAAGIARSHSVWDGPIDADRVGSVTAPSFVCIDHRRLGTWSADGWEEWMQHWRGQAELAVGFSRRDEDILAFTPAVNVLRHTYFGTSRASGGPFENVTLAVNVFDAEGLYARVEAFESDQESAVLARFDELTAGAEPKQPMRRRVRPNAATVFVARFDAAFAAQDLEALAALHADTYEETDHLTEVTYGREGVLASLRRILRSGNPRSRSAVLATLGDGLLVARRWISTSHTRGGHFDVAESEREWIAVAETDERGLMRRHEAFASDRLGEAIIRLYERYAEHLPEGPARARAAAVARAEATFTRHATDPDRFVAALAPAIEAVDHRTVGFGTLRGRDVVVGAVRALLDLSEDVSWRLDDVLALSEHASLVRVTQRGRSRASGGEWERPICSLRVHDSEGLVSRWEIFEAEQESEALARYDALVGRTDRASEAAPAKPWFANAATRAWDERLFVSWRARDWPHFAQHLAVGFRYVDRRRMLQRELDRDRFVEFTRQFGDMRSAHLETEVLATRGDRLALHRFRVEVADGEIGPSELEYLNLLDMNESGEVATWVRFDADDLDAAHAELDARYAVGKEAEHTRLLAVLRAASQTYRSHLGGTFADSYHPDVVVHDHRVLGWGMVRGLADFTRMQRSLVDLAPDTRLRIDHLRLADRGHMWGGALCGTRDGGAFELPFLAVREVDERGLVSRIDLYDPEQMDQARARFARLTSPPPTAEPFANAASATVAPVMASMIAHDWPRFAQLFADDFRMSDRRRVVQLELDRDQYIAFTREVADGRTIRAQSELLATRGERLALTRGTYEFADADVGPSEIAFLILTEVNGRGRIVAYARWDLEDLDAAYAELTARYEAGEGARHASFFSSYLRALARRDWVTIAALYPPDFVEHDNRVIGVLGTTRGPEAWMQDRALIELAPDTVVRVDHVRHAFRGLLSHSTWQGSRDGAHYEIPFIVVHELDDQGRLKRNDLYDPEQIDRAFARFAELTGPVSSPAPFANAATRAFDRGTTALGARDWAGFAALFAHDFRVYDRTSMGQFEAGGPQWLAGFREMVEMTSGPPTRQVLATRGERFALGRALWRGAGGDIGPSEVEWLLIIEVDDRGDHRVVVSCRPDDLDAAYAELDARFEAGEGVGRLHFMRAYLHAFARRDWDAIATLYPATFVEHDHRAGALLGTTRGAEAWTQDRALVELAPDTVVRVDHVRIGPRGYLSQVTWMGSRDGARYEIPFVIVTKVDEQDTLRRNDLYDPEQMDQARARFGELTAPAPTAERFANTATRALDRSRATVGARDWEGFVAHFAAEFRAYDRTRIGRLETGAADWLAGMRPMVEMTIGPPTGQVLATRGERLALAHLLWRGAAGDVGPSEVEWLQVAEVDDRGDTLAVVLFDPNDVEAAYAELDARWRAGEEREHPCVAAYQTAFERRLARRDWDALARLYAPTLVARDHRLVGWDTLRGPAAFVGAFRALVDLAPDVRVHVDHTRMSERGIIGDVAWAGTRDGGAFESPFINVVELDADGKAVRLDLYDPHHLDAALARFDEISASAPGGPLAAIAKPNAATATMERWQATFDAALEADDWEAVRGLCAAGMIFEDRQRMALVSGNAELMIASARERARAGARAERRLVGTAGDRVVIARMLWSGGPPGGRFEIEYFTVVEVDEAGLLTAIIFFDLDAAGAAQREAWARWAVIEPEMAENLALLTRALDAFNAHDLDAYLATVADDVLVVDHRRKGMGRIEGPAAYAASVEALWSLAPGTTTELGWHWAAYGRHGVITVNRRHGTLADGGAYESEYLVLFVQARGCFTNIETFELEDLDAALARFEDLR